MASTPIWQNIHFDPTVCNSFKQLGLSLSPSTAVSSNFMFRPPVTFGNFCELIRTKIDSYSYAWNFTVLRNASIGRYCSIAHNVEIGLIAQSTNTLSTSTSFTTRSPFSSFVGDIDRLDPIARFVHDDCAPVNIGHDVWIGTRVYIAGGVNIGTGAIIGTGSYITHDVPPYAIVSGRDDHAPDSSCILKRYRFSDEVIADLLESKWWEYDLPQLMSSMQNDKQQLPFDNVHEFLSFMRNSDTSSWPRLDQPWFLIDAKDATHGSVSPVPEDYELKHLYESE